MANLTWLFEEGNADSALFAIVLSIAKPTALKSATAKIIYQLCSVGW